MHRKWSISATMMPLSSLHEDGWVQPALLVPELCHESAPLPIHTTVHHLDQLLQHSFAAYVHGVCSRTQPAGMSSIAFPLCPGPLRLGIHGPPLVFLHVLAAALEGSPCGPSRATCQCRRASSFPRVSISPLAAGSPQNTLSGRGGCLGLGSSLQRSFSAQYGFEVWSSLLRIGPVCCCLWHFFCNKVSRGSKAFR